MKTFAQLSLSGLLALLTISPALSLETSATSDLRSVVQTVIGLTYQHALPGWSEPGFQAKLRPYLSDDLLSAVSKGAKIATKKGNDLYNGEFFTSSQDLAHAKLFTAEMSKLAGDTASVEVSVGSSSDPNVEPDVGGKVRFQLKRGGGAWRIDDFKNLEDYAKAEPSIKTLFNDAVRYRQ